MRRCLAFLGVLTVCVGALGCSEDGLPGQAPPFPEGQGQLPKGGVAYPGGPYGLEKGNVIANFGFEGYPNPIDDRSVTQPIALSDFYNPTGDQLYGPDSVYGEGEPKPKALLVIVSAVWCQPCQHEASVLLPDEYARYAPKGVQFLLILADGPEVGVAATLNHLDSWTNNFDTDWPAVIDPNYTIGALFKANAFPVNILIDTSTMKVAQAIAGLPDEDGPLFEALNNLVGE